jgi:hypothetical protein
MQAISERDKLVIQEILGDVMDCEYETVSIETDELTQLFLLDIPNPDIDLWEKKLSRQLIKEEKKLIHEYLLEIDTNLQLKSLHLNMCSHGVFSIPKLTKANGNCLFESLSHLGFGKPSEIRKGIASLLHLIRAETSFFSKINVSPEELFLNCNDTEMVRDSKTGEVYEYDYDMMCMDLYTSTSWKRLPTELILMAICRVYEIEIKIFSNKSKYVNTISVFDDPSIPTYYLGHINEEHYVPVIKIPDDISKDYLLANEFITHYPVHISSKKQYINWANAVLEKSTSKTTTIQTSKINYSDYAMDDFFIVE